MRVIALGVNGAYTVGHYDNCVSLAEIEEVLTKLGGLSQNAQMHELTKRSKKVYLPEWQSNFLLEFDMPNKRGIPGEPYRLLLDCGCDIRHSLAGIGMSFSKLDGVYVSHPHADHIGGMEGFALMTIFNPYYTQKKFKWLNGLGVIDRLMEHGEMQNPPDFAKPDLFVHPKVLSELRSALQPGLNTLQGISSVMLETYFNIIEIGRGSDSSRITHDFIDGNQTWKVKPVFTIHVVSSSEEMPSYGISLESNKGTFLLFPTDTQHMMPPQMEILYRRADVIYMDCETTALPSGVHPHITDLVGKMPSEIQKKCYLYHYQERPQYPDLMFKGVLRMGECHTY